MVLDKVTREPGTNGSRVAARWPDDAVSGAADRGSRLLERETELNLLQGLTHGTLPSRRACVMIEGGWGTGKTALLGQACEVSRRAGITTVRASGHSREYRPRYELVADLLAELERSWAGSVGTLEALSRVRETLRDVHLRPGVLGQQLAEAVSVQLAEAPLMVGIDDADLADNESIWAILAFRRRLAEAPCLLVVTGCPRHPGMALRPMDWLLTELDTSLLHIESLGADSVGRLAVASRGARATPAFIESLHAATGGRPFFVNALLAKLASDDASGQPQAARTASGQAQATRTASGQPQATEAASGQLLATDTAGLSEVACERIAHAVLERLARLPIAAADLLQAAAILGDTDIDAARRLARIDSAAAERGAEAAVRAELLAPGQPLRFSTPVVRAAVVHEITRTRTSRLHADAATLLAERGAPDREIAAHLLRTEPTGNARTVELLQSVAQAALASDEPDLAVSCFERAMREPPEPARRPDVLLGLAEAEVCAGLPGAADHLHQVVRLGTFDVERLVRAMVELIRRMHGPVPFSAPTAEAAREAAEGLGPSGGGLRLELELALRLVASEPGPPDLEDFERLIEACPSSDARLRRLAEAHLLTMRMGRASWAPADAVADHLLATLVPREARSDDLVASRVTILSALALAACGRHPEADAVLAPTSRQTGNREAAAVASIALSISLLGQGALSGAAEAARSAQVLLGPVDDRYVMAGACLTAALLDQGGAARSQAMSEDDALGGLAGLASLVADPARASAPVLACFLRQTSGRLQIAQGHLEAALDALMSHGRLAAEAGIDNPAISSWRADAAGVLAQLGRPQEAYCLAEEHLALARSFGEPRSLGAALRIMAGVGPERNRLNLLEEAVAVLETSHAALERGRTLLDLGVVLRLLNRAPAARSALRRAVHLASLCGAAGLLETASAELRAAGGRPRRAALTGWAALTPAEARVAGLAATGLTNQRIAADLYVTEKTVEGHLARAYRKLDLRSRSELAAAARDTLGDLTDPDEPMPDEPMPDEPVPDEPLPDEPAPDEPVPGKRVSNEPVPGERTKTSAVALDHRSPSMSARAVAGK